MNKFLIIGFCTFLSFGITSCYAPVDKAGNSTLTYSKPQSESQKAAENYIALAFKYINANQLSTARAKLDQSRDFEPNNPRIYLGYALIYDKEKESELAGVNYKKASDLGGGAEVSMYRALSYYNQGLYSQAQTSFAQCMNDTVFDLRALCFELNGFNEMRLANVDKAIESFIKATQLNTNMPTSYLSLANLYLQKSDPKAGYVEFKKYHEMVKYIDSVSHTAQSLWIGIQLANAVGDSAQMQDLVIKLKVEFQDSEEYKLYQQWSANAGAN